MKKIDILWLWLFIGLLSSVTTQAQVHDGADAILPQHHNNVMNNRNGWIETTITVTVDSYYNEASWNLYNMNSESYYFATDQMFEESNQTITKVIYLSEGNYEIQTYDSYGDGGIKGNVVEAGGDTLVSWDENDYEEEGQFPFSISVEDWEFVAYPDTNNTPGNANIILEWGSPAGDIASYNIYRAEGEGSGLAFDSIDNVDTSVNQYIDSTVNAGATYSYYLTGIIEDSLETNPSQTVVTSAATGPEFSITPESYNFDEVGLLDGEVYYGAENAFFSVKNPGVDEFQVDDVYIYSGGVEAFDYLGTEEFPVSIMGPFESTGDEFTFEVSFNPPGAGVWETLLVIEDNLGREVRTFPLQGSAYDIPNYDLVENAYVINQDWGLNADYMVEDMSFDNYDNDYDLGTPPKKDVAFQTNIAKESFLEFTQVSGVADFAVFPDSTTNFVEDNNIYEDEETTLPAGTYYIIASGSGDFAFNLHIEGQEPELAIEPETMNLGEVPIDAWHEGGAFKVYNAGGQSVIIEEASISDENGVFILDHHYELPVEITADTLYFDIFLDADEVGSYEGAFLLTDTTTTYMYDFMGETYMPVEGDVLENPIMVTFDGDNHYENTNSVADPMHDNYHLVDGYGDLVYKFSYPTDMIIDIALDSYDEGLDPLMELYSAEDVNDFNPDQLEPVHTATDSMMNRELWGGTYYLVIAGDTATPNYTINFDVEDMPAPGEITLVAPGDEADDLPVDNTTLEWELGDYSNTIDVYLDTQYPPEEKVLDSADATDSVIIDNMAPAQIYFWKVVAHNMNGSSESETWGFTTELPSPNQVTGEIFDFVNVHLEWVDPFIESESWTEDFEDGEIPDGWSTMTNAEGSTAGWIVTENGSSPYFNIPPHSYYAVANDDMEGTGSDGSMDYLITPQENFAGWETIALAFDSYYTGDYSHKAYVELSTDEGDTWEVVHELEPNSSWTEVNVDLSEYNTEDYSSVWIGFHSDDQGGWASGWAVDNISLEKEQNAMNRALQGYNVYQNGEVINEEVIEQEFYNIFELAAGTYTFGVSAVYDEGESEVVSIDEMEILGMGGIEGTVSDVDTDEPIPGANITIVSNAPGVYDTTLATDSTGFYSAGVPVLEQDYSVTTAASGYADSEENGVVVDPEEYTVLDFVLGDIPLPVSNVTADNNDEDTKVTVTWDEPGQGEMMELLQHADTAQNSDFFLDLWSTTAYEDDAAQLSQVETPDSPGKAEHRIRPSARNNDGTNSVTQQVNTFETGNRELQHYEIYRLEQGLEGNPDNWELLADDITETQYVDTLWADLETGVYKYAVKAVYTITESEAMLSNKVGKNMAAEAVVIVSLNTGDSPEGATVLFENVNEPEYTYEETVPASGTIEIDSLWKGTYDLTVSKENYNTYTEYDIDIMENYFIRDVELQETLAIPQNLSASVDCDDVLLTWEQGTSGGSGNSEFADDFETGAFAEEWTLEEGTGNSWQVDDTYAYEGDYGAYTPWGYDINTWLMTPEIDLSDNHVVSFAWQSSYYWSVEPNDNADLFVKISTDEGTTWQTLWTFGEIGEWEDWTWYETTLDLSDFSDETVMLAFNLVADDNADVTLDNVYVGEQASRAVGTKQVTNSLTAPRQAKNAPQNQQYEYLTNIKERELLGYNIYRNGMILNNQPVQDTAYLDENLAGGTLNYEVSAIYTTGESPYAGPVEAEVETINPPQYLQAEKQSWNNVELTWEAPLNQPAYSLHWDNGENYTSIGSGEAFDFDVASRWTPEDLEAYDEMYLTKVSFYPDEEQAEYYIRVWTGEDATLIVDQSVEDVTVGAWNTVELDTPVQIDATEELWFGYRADAETGYPAGCDVGPALTGKGDMINDPEAGWVTLSEAYDLDYNWNISGVVTDTVGQQQYRLSEINDTQRNGSSSTGEISTSGYRNRDPQKLNNDRSLIGYNVFRNGDIINEELITVNYYYDLDLPIGQGSEFEYYVVAQYENECSSQPSNIQVVDYATDTDNTKGEEINLYPNPATNRINATIPDNIASLRVINVRGQKLYEKHITSENAVRIDTKHFEAGAYLVKFLTSKGNVFYRRFVVIN